VTVTVGSSPGKPWASAAASAATDDVGGQYAQGDWRYCQGCDQLFWLDLHAAMLSTPQGWEFVLQHDVGETSNRQAHWRFCQKCRCLFYDGTLAGEVGELLAELQWLTPEEAVTVMDDPDAGRRVRAELGDVTIYLVRPADALGVDLVEAAHAKLDEGERRSAPDTYRGSARKAPPLR
jgi:NTP pyrophosphatase (non-canonical NTP hydrolase)